MNTVLAIPCRSTPDAQHILDLVESSGAGKLILSVAEDADFPPLTGEGVIMMRHKNAPFPRNDGSTLMRHIINNINVPIAVMASTHLVDADVVFFVHDDVKVDAKTFAFLAEQLEEYSFASVGPIYRKMPVTEEPYLFSHSTRCVAWRPKSFLKYVGRALPDDEPAPEESMRLFMQQMDEDGEKYIWTDRTVTHI